MVCVGWETAERDEGLCVPLAKKRRIDRRVLFRLHAIHLLLESESGVPGISVSGAVMSRQDGMGRWG